MMKFAQQKWPFDEYPITPDMQRRAEYFGDASQLLAVLRQGEGGKRLVVDVIGGSFTAGHELDGRLDNKDLAWPATLEKELRTWVDASVRNWALGGHATLGWVGHAKFWKSYSLDPPDILLIEMGVNDQLYGDALLGRKFPLARLEKDFKTLIHRSLLSERTAVVAVESFRTAGYYSRDACKHCGETCHDKSSIHPLDPKYTWCQHWWEVPGIHQKVLKELSVPYFSYRDAVWPIYEEPPKDLPKYWNGLSHPDWVAHELIGRGVAQMMLDARSQLCTGHAESVTTRQREDIKALLSSEGSCVDAPSTAFSASGGIDAFPALASSASQTVGVWEFREDQKGKPGWIAEVTSSTRSTSSESLVIAFPLTLGAQGLVTVSYLQSYHNMGKVQWWLDDDISANGYIDGFDEAPFSISMTSVLPVKLRPLSHTVIKFKLILQEVSAVGGEVVRGNKFKLLGIEAC